MEGQTTAYGFTKEFDYEGRHYSMHVIPFITANDQDKWDFHLSEGEFLVHLNGGDTKHSFAVCYNDKLEWDANVSRILIDDKFLIERIGFLIDDYYA